jgi:hypothetical protein
MREKLISVSPIALRRLQEFQAEHDAKHHGDVHGLPRAECIRHLVLHFAKYSGRLVDCTSHAEEMFSRTLVDTFIVSMSARNVLGLPANELEYWQLPGPPTSPPLPFFRLALAKQAGLLAKACEALDHREQIDYAGIYREGVNAILRAVIAISFAVEIDIATLTEERWKEIAQSRVV